VVLDSSIHEAHRNDIDYWSKLCELIVSNTVMDSYANAYAWKGGRENPYTHFERFKARVRNTDADNDERNVNSNKDKSRVSPNFDPEESSRHYFRRVGLVGENNDLGVRFRIRILLREVALYCSQFVKDVDEFKKEALESKKNKKPANKGYHLLTTLGAQLFVMGNFSSVSKTKEYFELGRTSGPYKLKVERRQSQSTDDKQDYESITEYEFSDSGYLLNISQGLLKYIPQLKHTPEHLHKILFERTFEGEGAYENYCRHVVQLLRGQVNYTLLRKHAPKLFDSLRFKSDSSNQNKDIYNGLVLDQQRKETLKQINDSLRPSEQIYSPLVLVHGDKMQQALNACVACLLDSPESIKTDDEQWFDAHSHFTHIVYVPCSSDVFTKEQITYPRLVGFLHAYFYPEEYTGVLKNVKKDSYTPRQYESLLDLAQVRLEKEDSASLRTALKGIRRKLMKEPTLIVFNGLDGNDSYQAETYYTRVAIENNPVLMLIRNLTSPAISDVFYQQHDGGLTTFFKSRILVFSTAEQPDLKIYSQFPTIELSSPDAPTGLLVDVSTELTNRQELKNMFKSGFDAGTDDSLLILVDSYITLLKRHSALPTESGQLTFLKPDTSDEMAEKLLAQTLLYEPIFAVTLAILSITNSGLRPITMIRLLSRFNKTMAHYETNATKGHSRLFEQLREALNKPEFKGLKSYQKGMKSAPNSLTDTFFKQFKMLLRVTKIETDSQPDAQSNISGYLDDVVECPDKEQEALFGTKDKIREAIRSNEAIEINDIEIKRCIKNSLERVLGREAVGLFHYLICEESLRQHTIVNSRTYWLDESYRLYRHMLQALMHGFLCLRLPQSETLIGLVEAKIPKKRAKLFMFLYHLLYKDLTEHHQYYQLLRKYEVANARAEILELAATAFECLTDEEKCNVTNITDDDLLQEDEMEYVHTNQWLGVEHDLNISIATSWRRAGRLDKSVDIITHYLKSNVELPEHYRYDCNKMLIDVEILGGKKLSGWNSKARLSETTKKVLGKNLEITFKHALEVIIEQLKKGSVKGYEDVLHYSGVRHVRTLIYQEVKKITLDSGNSLSETKATPTPLFAADTKSLFTLAEVITRLAETYYYQSLQSQDFNTESSRLNLLSAYIYYEVGSIFRKKLFALEPDGRYHYLNAHQTRANIRLLFKLHVVTQKYASDIQPNFMQWPGMGNFELLDQARYLLDSLSLVVGLFPRERPALLIQESIYSRLRFREFGEAFKLICQSERYLTTSGDMNYLVSARLHSERIKLLLDLIEYKSGSGVSSHNGEERKSKLKLNIDDKEMERIIVFDYLRLSQLVSYLKTRYWKANLLRRREEVEKILPKLKLVEN
jgi:hypothetical protein